MALPLDKQLKRKSQIDLANLQDEVLEILYSIDNKIILHGGTAIWRCYNGKRFSEDLDLYSSSSNLLFEKIEENVAKHGLQLVKLKKTQNLLFCKVRDANSIVGIEINFAKKKSGTIKSYQNTDGTFLDIITLKPEELILEKIAAYENRKFIRDIYDIYHLAKLIEFDKELRKHLCTFLLHIEKPIDERNLKTLIYSGAIPTFNSIVEYLRSICT